MMQSVPVEFLQPRTIRTVPRGDFDKCCSLNFLQVTALEMGLSRQVGPCMALLKRCNDRPIYT